MTVRRLVALALMPALLGACGGAVTSMSAAPTTAGSTADASGTVWLCRPGIRDNPCASDLTATVVRADGTTTIQRASVASNPPIDCFYVYPTVSMQTTANANLTIGPEERAVAVQQASRFSQVCRVYAPMYRQLTLSAIGGRATPPNATAIAYGSVLSAWRDYLAHYNHGRGVVLIGHSQGAAMLIALMRREVDPNPAVRRQLVSALLMGGNATVQVGRRVGGDFEHVPVCDSAHEAGCVVAYSSFLTPPPPGSLFGRVGQGVGATGSSDAALQVVCANPAAIGGGFGDLEPYFDIRSSIPGSLGAAAAATLGGAPAPRLTTPWVTFPDLYGARCETSGGATWLQVSRVGPPSDPRPRLSQSLGPTWGLHLVDVNLALGNLVSLVRSQAVAYRSR